MTESLHSNALLIVAAVSAMAAALLVVMVEKETKRICPELSDLPAALLAIFIIATAGYGVRRLQRISVEANGDSAERAEQSAEPRRR